MVGSLLYTQHTRPDVAHAVGMLGRMLENSTQPAPVTPVTTQRDATTAAARRGAVSTTTQHGAAPTLAQRVAASVAAQRAVSQPATQRSAGQAGAQRGAAAPVSKEEKEEKDRVAREKALKEKEKQRDVAMRTLQRVCVDLGAVRENQILSDHFDARSTCSATSRPPSTTACATTSHQVPARDVKQSDALLRIEAYSDSDFAGNVNDGKSTTGFVVLLNGMVVDYQSKKQTVVARSTCAAENLAMAAAIERCKSLYAMLVEMGFNVAQPVVIWGDNYANNNIMTMGGLYTHGRTHFVDVYVVDEVHVQHSVKLKMAAPDIRRVDSKNNLADIFTKTFGADRFIELRDKLVSAAPVQWQEASQARDGD